MSHNVSLSDTPLGQLILEKAEDELAEITEHYRNPQVPDDAESTVTLTLKLKPRDRRTFDVSVAIGSKRAGKKGHLTTIFVKEGQAGIEFHWADPRQERLPF